MTVMNTPFAQTTILSMPWRLGALDGVRDVLSIQASHSAERNPLSLRAEVVKPDTSARLSLLFILKPLVIYKLFSTFAAKFHINYVFIMARPIRETPVLKGEDAFNFEMRRLEVENRTPEERAEARRKFQERVAEASKHIQWCW